MVVMHQLQKNIEQIWKQNMENYPIIIELINQKKKKNVIL